MDVLKCPKCGAVMQPEMPLSEFWVCPNDLSVWLKDVMLETDGKTTIRKIYLVEQKRKSEGRNP